MLHPCSVSCIVWQYVSGFSSSCWWSLMKFSMAWGQIICRPTSLCLRLFIKADRKVMLLVLPIKRSHLSKPRKKAFIAMAPVLCVISPEVRLAQLYWSFTRHRRCGNVPSMGIEVLIGTFEIIELMVIFYPDSWLSIYFVHWCFLLGLFFF